MQGLKLIRISERDPCNCVHVSCFAGICDFYPFWLKLHLDRRDNETMPHVPTKQYWMIWGHITHKSYKTYELTTTNQSTTQAFAYFKRYVVHQLMHNISAECIITLDKFSLKNLTFLFRFIRLECTGSVSVVQDWIALKYSFKTITNRFSSIDCIRNKWRNLSIRHLRWGYVYI